MIYKHHYHCHPYQLINIIAIFITLIIIIPLIIIVLRRATAQLATRSTVSMSQRVSPTALKDQDLQHRLYPSFQYIFKKALIYKDFRGNLL